MADETSKMRATVDGLRKPLRDTLVATIQRGRDLASQVRQAPKRPSQDSRIDIASTSQGTTQEFQTITAKFKELAAATVPLSQENSSSSIRAAPISSNGANRSAPNLNTNFAAC